MLYIPQYWWHQVRSFRQPNIAVGMWFDIFNFQREYEERNILDVVNVVKVIISSVYVTHVATRFLGK